MSKTKTETPVLRNSADIPWEENRPRHKVDKRIYVLLTVFWAGAVHTAFWSTAGNWASSTCLSAGPVSALHLLWLTS